MRKLLAQLFVALSRLFKRLAGRAEEQLQETQPLAIEPVPTPVHIELHLPKLEIDVLARTLDLERLGRERGHQEQPSTNNSAIDEIELTILREAEMRFDAAEDEWGRVSYLNELQVESTAIDSHIRQISEKARIAASDLRTEAGNPLNETFLARERARDYKRHLDDFRRENKLNRPSRYPESGTARMAILVALIAIEALFNGSQLATGLPTGMIGGWVQAMVFAVFNAGVAFLLGWASRYVNHRRLLLRLGGGFLLVMAAVWAVGMNVGVAHFRDALSLDPDNASTIALASLRAHPFAISNFYSLLLLLMGLVFFVIAFIDGFGFEDRYPSYGPVDREYQLALRDFAALRAEALDQLSRSKDAKIRSLQIEAEFVAARIGNYAERIRRVKEMQNRLRRYRDSLEADSNRLVEIYRRANTEARTTPAPVHFQVPLHLNRSKCVSEVVCGKVDFPVERVNASAGQVIDTFEEVQRSFPTLEQL